MWKGMTAPIPGQSVARACDSQAPAAAVQPQRAWLSTGLQVGAALSMVYTSGAPIMFVGCGQTYVDLKRLNVKSVVRSLLK